MRRLAFLVLMTAVPSGSAMAEICPDEAADAALVEAGLDPAATDVHTVQGLGQFAIATRHNLSRQAVARTELDADGKTELIYKYWLGRVREKPVRSLSFQFMMPREGTDCSDPMLVSATFGAGEAAEGIPFETSKLRALISGDSPHVTVADLGDGVLRLDRVVPRDDAAPMFAYVGDEFVLRLAGGNERAPGSTYNGLDGESDLAVRVSYPESDPLRWRRVHTELKALLDAWRVE